MELWPYPKNSRKLFKHIQMRIQLYLHLTHRSRNCFYLTANKKESRLEICSIKYLTSHFKNLLSVFYLFKYLIPWVGCIDPIWQFCISTNTNSKSGISNQLRQAVDSVLSATVIHGLMRSTLNWFWWHTVWFTDDKPARREHWYRIGTSFSAETRNYWNLYRERKCWMDASLSWGFSCMLFIVNCICKFYTLTGFSTSMT